MATFVFAGGIGAASADTSDKAIDDYLRHEMAERHIIGMAVAVIQGGKVRKIGIYGQASKEFSLPVRPSTPFSVASISKSFTAVAVMMLVESGKLRLDDPIGSYLSGLPPGWHGITVRQLLSHTSGLPDIAVDDYGTSAIAETPAEMMKVLAKRSADFSPGSNYRYNQTNYVLLGMLIERVSGMPYEEFCAQRLFAPLRLRTPVFGDARTIVTERATTYTPFRYGGPRPVPLDHAEVLNAEMPAMTYPGGGLNISISDFADWLTALLSGKLISEASLKAIWAPTTLVDGSIFQRPPTPSLWRGYGLGWVLGLEEPHPFAGGTGGMRASFFVYPKDDVAVIVLTNTQGSRPESLVEGVARRYFAGSD
ncbi:MAG TPA: serine hydrolase domain-containing protein [Steroidobacter sp.]|uniref:serine hydrolase domain-containing protein n=1 Tax=Steroidobacter sp. TaxID=1978227 RepID=UPI002ED88F10